jgi:hypothetical protein
MRARRALPRTILALWLAWILLPHPPAGADAVRLKDGKTIEGHIVREDSAAIVIVSSGVPHFIARADVEGISRSGARMVTPAAVSEPAAMRPAEPVAIDLTIVERIRARLGKLHATMRAYRNAVAYAVKGRTQLASIEAHLATEGLLPVRHGRFDPFSALADLLILLGLRAPTLWLSLLLVKQGRSFTRIAELLVIGYGVVMLGMAASLLSDRLWIHLVNIPVTFGATALLLGWMCDFEPRRAVVALGLAVGLNLGIEHLLVHTHLI